MGDKAKEMDRSVRQRLIFIFNNIETLAGIGAFLFIFFLVRGFIVSAYYYNTKMR